jgi:hypothetical protein
MPTLICCCSRHPRQKGFKPVVTPDERSKEELLEAARKRRRAPTLDPESATYDKTWKQMVQAAEVPRWAARAEPARVFSEDVDTQDHVGWDDLRKRLGNYDTAR